MKEEEAKSRVELRSCVKVEVDVSGLPGVPSSPYAVDVTEATLKERAISRVCLPNYGLVSTVRCTAAADRCVRGGHLSRRCN